MKRKSTPIFHLNSKNQTRKQILKKKKGKKRTENEGLTSATKGLCLKLQGAERWSYHQT